MSAELENRGVALVAVCSDTPQEIAEARDKHGLRGTFLADPDLEVTDLFGLRNLATRVHKSGLPGVAVPTTLLVGANGEVLWRDQAENYLNRTGTERVRRAVEEFC